MSIKPRIKSYLPSTLFGRALLILVVPVVAVQLFSVYMFYTRHWDSVVRNLSSALAGEVVVLIDAFQNTKNDERMHYTRAIGVMMGIDVSYDESKSTIFVEGVGEDNYPDFFRDLSYRLDYPFMVQRSGEDDGEILVSVLMDQGTLNLRMTKKRLVSSTTYIFLFWMLGSAIVMMMIATLFLRNQIRPIRQLALAAERFGLGQDTPDFSPRGAAEVRQAGAAFLTMRQRIRRQVATRTEMLAGISHDLRTPLTRMKLQLALVTLDDKTRKSFAADLEEMEYMIQEYLDFARGAGQEPSEHVSMRGFLEEIINAYRFHDQPAQLHVPEGDVSMLMKPKALRRAIQNVIDNALRYGGQADVRLRIEETDVVIEVEDAGPGIPEEKHEAVFRPFTRLDPSRNAETGGAGLGLSIVRDSVVAHGGQVSLHNMKTGLKVSIRLPVLSSADE